MLETILANFQDNPSLVSEHQQATFNGCMNALASHEHIGALMSDQAAEDFWFREDDWRARYRPYSIDAGILTIPVKGVLLHDFPWTIGGYATGYEYILKAFQRGQTDPNVRGIAFHIHSPGGDVAGCFDAVDKMYNAKGSKPVRAFAHEYAYSAAYAIATVADKIIMSRSGGVGSIGVVTSHFDHSKALEAEGIKVTFIQFGAHKTDGNPYQPLSKDAQERIQARINDLGEVFVASVARNRKMDSKKVRETEALTYSASEAISIGLADAVGPLDDAVAAFAADLNLAQQGEEQMTKENTAVDEAAIKTAKDQRHAEGHVAGLAEGTKIGAAQEQARISAILASDEAKKRPKAAMAAVKQGMPLDVATAFLAELDEEAPKGIVVTGADQFISAVEGGAPNISAGDGTDADANDPAAIASAITKRMGWTK